jgi:hypothetical protein
LIHHRLFERAAPIVLFAQNSLDLFPDMVRHDKGGVADLD